MIKVIQVVGVHGAGKTMAVEVLVRELVRRGRRVGTVKHITEKDFTIDQAGKDTWVHARAGASAVVSVAPGETAWVLKRREELGEVLNEMKDVEIVVVEGFRSFKGYPKIIAARTEKDVEEVADEFSVAVVGASGRGLPSFSLDDAAKLADFAELKALPPMPELNCKRCGYNTCVELYAAVLSGKAKLESCQTLPTKVIVRVDGRELALNPFVQEIVQRTIQGMVSSLRGGEGGI
ncbi:MAG: molybdopterin-guanine dinucleotide biosynthesis protein B, partial [Candidatus Zixiibacteriota bacterium]